MTYIKTLLAFVLFFTLASQAAAQSLAQRHQLELRLGLWNQVGDVEATVGVGGVTTSVGSTGFLGAVAWGYWLQENLSIRASVGAMAAQVNTDIGITGLSTETASVAQLLFGMRYYFPASTYGSSIRPFAGAAVGAFIGSQVTSDVGFKTSATVGTEAAPAGELGAGVDFLIGQHVSISAALAYALQADFDRPIGGSRNYSGPQLSFGFGYVFGRGSN